MLFISTNFNPGIVSGNIAIKCAAGMTLSTTTSTSGTWSVTFSDQTLPCAVEVSGGAVNGIPNTTAYHSIALDAGTVNLTPLTDLVVADLAGQAPGTWFESLTPEVLSQKATVAAVNTALANVRAALGSVSGMTSLGNVNPMTADFKPATGDEMDAMLEALNTAMSKAGSSHSAMIASASTGGAFTVDLTPAGSGSGSGAGGGTSTGTSTLTLSVSVDGAPTTTATINGVPKPASETEFCGGLADSSSSTSLSNALGAAGSFTVNSCSFDGTTGSVSATLDITSPVALTVPYTVTYTYGG